jgi:hypothetical protein
MALVTVAGDPRCEARCEAVVNHQRTKDDNQGGQEVSRQDQEARQAKLGMPPQLLRWLRENTE